MPPTNLERARIASQGLYGDDPIYAIQITHPDVNPDIRVIMDGENAMIGGETFLMSAFIVTLPTEKGHEARRIEVTLDNVGRQMVEWVEASNGGRGATMNVMEVVFPAGDRNGEVLTEYPGFQVGNARMRNENLIVSLVDESAGEAPGIKMRHDPETSPGLF